MPAPRNIRDALARFESRLTANLMGAANRIVDVAAAEMESKVPRLTGDLADSIEVAHATIKDGTITASVTVGEGLESPGEAAAVEFGTSKMLPQPYFRPGCNRGRDIAQHEMEKAAKAAL